jgi:hypothetical protein
MSVNDKKRGTLSEESAYAGVVKLRLVYENRRSQTLWLFTAMGAFLAKPANGSSR